MSKQFTLPYEGGLIENNLPAGILHNYEKIWTEIFPESVPAASAVADIIVSSVNACEGRLFRLGLTTGVTPIPLYEELLRRYRAGELSFRNVEVVSIDEYYPSSSDSRQSRNHRLHEALLDQVDILPENIHILDGNAADLDAECASFEEAIAAAG